MSITSINPFNALGGASGQSSTAGTSQSDLGQEEYLKLMITQFQNQDPFKPMENGDFLGQIAQFGTVSGIAELKESFGSVAASISSDQTLQASGLIGRTVLADTNTGTLTKEGLSGAVDVPISTSSVAVEVRDSAGQVVRRMEFGSHTGGLAQFTWDGVTEDGSAAPEGNYSFHAQIVAPGGSEAVGVLIAAEVESVSLSPYNGALSLNLANVDSLGLHQVRQIM